MQKDYEVPSTELTLGLASSSRTTTPFRLVLDDQVSTALTLWDPTWNYNANKRKSEELVYSPTISPSVLAKPKRQKLSAKKPKRNQVFVLKTTMSLQPRGPWKIWKKLTRSDIDSCSRLLMPKGAVKDHVLCYLDDKFVDRVKSDKGLEVTVQDCDTHTSYQLTFKLWESAQFYILNGGWRQLFVRRRELKEKDEIGLYWDTLRAMFMFSLLRRANPIGQLSPA